MTMIHSCSNTSTHSIDNILFRDNIRFSADRATSRAGTVQSRGDARAAQPRFLAICLAIFGIGAPLARCARVC